MDLKIKVKGNNTNFLPALIELPPAITQEGAITILIDPFFSDRNMIRAYVNQGKTNASMKHSHKIPTEKLISSRQASTGETHLDEHLNVTIMPAPPDQLTTVVDLSKTPLSSTKGKGKVTDTLAPYDPPPKTMV